MYIFWEIVATLLHSPAWSLGMLLFWLWAVAQEVKDRLDRAA